MLSRRELAQAGAVAGAAIAGAAAGGAMLWRGRNPGTLQPFDPELRPFVERFLDHPPPDLTSASLAAFRAMETASAPSPLPGPAVTRTVVAGLNGAPPVGVHLINAQAQGARAAILYVHGGGFVMGNAAGAVRQLQGLAAALDCVAVAVDYRLAPEVRHDAMLDDCNAVLRWVHDQAAGIGVDPSRIAIMGASAGGGLAALLAMRARDENVVRPCFQLLVYPMLDNRTGTTAGAKPPCPTLLWSEANNRFGWNAFLGPTGDAGAVPGRRTDLAGLPPTLIAVGSVDLFLGEDVAFATELAQARVPVALKIIPGAFHGFDLAVPRSRVAARLRTDIEAALGKVFADRD